MATPRVLQKWEGFVLEVTEDSFWARLVDLTEEGPEEEAEFPLEKVSAEEQERVVPGAVFYWSIEYHDTSSGPSQPKSIIHFPRLPIWQKEEIENALKQAEEIGERLGWLKGTGNAQPP